MTSPASEGAPEAAVLAPQGTLNLSNAAAALADGLESIRAGARVLDLGAVGAVDSAGLGVVLEWCRQARAAGAELELRNVPTSLRQLAELYGLRDILPT